MKLSLYTLMYFLLLTSFQTLSTALADEHQDILYWVAPMDPNFRKDGPGKSPMGMDLVPVYANQTNSNSAEVMIAPEVIQNLGVRTTIVERSSLARKIATVGSVQYDESKMAHIHLRTQGWIEQLQMRAEGERVQKDDFLFSLYSPELINAQEELLSALMLGNKSLIKASQDRLIALGVPDPDIQTLKKTRQLLQTISYFAPQDGVVANLMVREGMFVKPENQIATLADLSSIWVLAEVFESDSAWVQTGLAAEVKFGYLPGYQFKGVVEYIYPDLDPVTRALTVRLKFKNSDELLKPNMFGEVSIHAHAKSNIIIIPSQALIRTGNNERVIVAQGDGRFEARDVIAGMESDNKVEIKSGLEAGEEIVISGQFLIDSEASSQASFMRMSGTPEDHDHEHISGVEIDDVIIGHGVVTAIDQDNGIIRIDHQPIAELAWPSMEMNFTLTAKLKETLPEEMIHVHDHIQFEMKKVDMKYHIDSVSVIHQHGGH